MKNLIAIFAFAFLLTSVSLANIDDPKKKEAKKDTHSEKWCEVPENTSDPLIMNSEKKNEKKETKKDVKKKKGCCETDDKSKKQD